MPVPATVPLAPQRPPASSHPSVITIPGTKPPASRRYASNPATHITAYVLPGGGADTAAGSLSTVRVALKRNTRLLGCTLDGHDAPIVDLEFLQTPPGSPIHVLGSCDRDGVVFLWFLYVAIDSLGIEVSLNLLKKYSFFTLRKSTTAFYTRIRLAGTVEAGTMVLVPNDGANVRVVTFSCEPTQPSAPEHPLLESSTAVPSLPPPAPSAEDRSVPPSDPTSKNAITTTALGATAVAGAAGATVGMSDFHDNDIVDDDDDDDMSPNPDLAPPTPPMDPALDAFAKAPPRGFERSMTSPLRATGDQDDEGDAGRLPLNSTFPMTRAEGQYVDVEDDLAAAAAMAAGLPVTEMEGALTHDTEVVDEEDEEDDEDFRDATAMVDDIRLDDDERDYIGDDLDPDAEEYDDAVAHAVDPHELGLPGRDGGVYVEGEGLGSRQAPVFRAA